MQQSRCSSGTATDADLREGHRCAEVVWGDTDIRFIPCIRRRGGALFGLSGVPPSPRSDVPRRALLMWPIPLFLFVSFEAALAHTSGAAGPGGGAPRWLPDLLFRPLRRRRRPGPGRAALRSPGHFAVRVSPAKQWYPGIGVLAQHYRAGEEPCRQCSTETRRCLGGRKRWKLRGAPGNCTEAPAPCTQGGFGIACAPDRHPGFRWAGHECAPFPFSRTGGAVGAVAFICPGERERVVGGRWSWW